MNKNVDIKLSVHDTLFGITFIRYAQGQNMDGVLCLSMFKEYCLHPEI